MGNKVMIIGAGGHARVVADIVHCSGNEVIGFLDDQSADHFPGMSILGNISEVMKFQKPGISFVIGIGMNDLRKRIASLLSDAHLKFYTAIHPSAVISKDAIIGIGTVIMANAVVNTGTLVGRHCIINTSATVDHDNTLGDYVHLSPGTHTSGTVSIGDSTWIGVGAVVNNNISICEDCIVGAGSVVVRNILEPGIYIGTPARKLARKI
jgi:sugar O-acyltransferase (sialic acid O-acetyltransferase NeuD family)